MVAGAVASDDWTGLSRPLERVLGKRSANALAKLGLATVRDLVYHFPFRLAKRGELMPISQVSEGDAVTVIARVLSTNLRPMNSRRGFILTVEVTDGENDLSLTFFAKNPRPLQYHERQLTSGTVATFSGTVSSYRGQLQLSHPEYDEPDSEKMGRPIPIYHAAEKVPSWKIEKAVGTVLPTLTEADFPDPLPEGYRAAHGLPSLFEAITVLHHPQEEEPWKRAQLRMKHEEAVVLQTALAERGRQARKHSVTAYPSQDGKLRQAFDEALPFTLTAGQQKVSQEIAADLSREVPMQRLLQGDVGSGKTVVALRGMLQVIDGGGQAALLAPTEVLAWQHLRTIEAMLGPEHVLDVGLEILTGSLTAAQRRRTLARIASGQAGLIVGTHALLSEDVQIPFLGLAVIDEQHRFGVDQRDRLASGVHTLVMTATPIPRTIAMSVFGDLDVSTLRELPAGRAGISTTIVPAANQLWMERVWQRTREEVDGGGRAYVVCPRIEPEEGQASVVEIAAALRADPALAGIEIGMIHGQLSQDEKTGAMEEFASGRIPVLVSTTVIEVGVDVREATLMVIMDADRFGLSQLHQLRGRIGRGTAPGLCLAVTGVPDGTLAKARLEAFASTTDGFVLAEEDLRLRSEGDVLGASQSGGISHLQFLSVLRDTDIIEQARTAARDLVEKPLPPALTAEVERLERAEYLEKG
ncbi:MAG: ATP-dependent DNA helicase RecG [Ancrocorticia sp.]|uniref:ATP-dependent DNA helicase RecG n=1 Tax=Ancrocorticia sp. TaxID=2593684 RepID=UPI003F921601